MGKFDGILICTDLDGTLLKNDKTISRENIEAINYFMAEGGFFTFITGRMPFFVSEALNKIKFNAPFGCVNGAGLYDFVKNDYIWTARMPESVCELIKCVDESFSDIGIQVNTFNKAYFCRDNQTMVNFRYLTGVKDLKCRYDEVTEPIAKIVFGSESESDIKAIEQMLRAHPLAEEFSFVRSEKELFEILPKGINKGTTVEMLCEYLKLKIENTIAIGDYNNDIPMFKAAGVGIAVANACDEAKRSADYTTVENEQNAIAEVIYGLSDSRYSL